MNTAKIIIVILGTIMGIMVIIAGGVAYLVYMPSAEGEKEDSFSCPEEQYSVMCVVRGYLVPSIDRN